MLRPGLGKVLTWGIVVRLEREHRGVGSITGGMRRGEREVQEGNVGGKKRP